LGLALVGSIAAFAAAPLACSVAVDLDGLSGGKADAGTDGGLGDGGPTACSHARWPDPPKTATEGGTVDFYAALRSIDLGETKPVSAGLDLDNFCTCETEGSSCAYPPYAADEKNHCDSAEGRDNAVAKLFKLIQDVVGTASFGSSVFSSKAEIGQWSTLLRISDYNGEPDDAQVTVALYETGWDETGKTPEPLWDGTDLWPVASSSLSDAVTIDSPVYLDAVAYVTGGILVASLPDAYLGFNGGGSTLGLRLTAGTLSGRIEKKGDRYRVVDGVLGGRWKADDIFKVIGAFDLGGQKLCNDGSTAYKRFKEIMCSQIDIASKLGGATTLCDSLSFGMSFSTEPAGVDKIYEPNTTPNPCSKGTDPANDSCDKM
jgi:hypothetical protein